MAPRSLGKAQRVEPYRVFEFSGCKICFENLGNCKISTTCDTTCGSTDLSAWCCRVLCNRLPWNLLFLHVTRLQQRLECLQTYSRKSWEIRNLTGPCNRDTVNRRRHGCIRRAHHRRRFRAHRHRQLLPSPSLRAVTTGLASLQDYLEALFGALHRRWDLYILLAVARGHYVPARFNTSILKSRLQYCCCVCTCTASF